MSLLPLLPHGRHRAARRRAESLLGAVLSRRAADDAGGVQAIDPRPSGLVQQLHGRLRRLRPDRRPDRRQAAVRYPRPQDRRPSRSSATGSWPSPAHLARLEARDSRPPANHRRSPRDARPCLRAVQRKRIRRGSAADRLRPGQREEKDRAGMAVASSSLSRSTISPPMVFLERIIRRFAGSARSRRSRQGRTTSQDLPSPPTSESRPTFFTWIAKRRGRDCVAPLFHRGRWSPSEATARLDSACEAEDLPVPEGPPGGNLEGVAWRRSVSAPPAGIASTQPRRGPSRRDCFARIAHEELWVYMTLLREDTPHATA